MSKIKQIIPSVKFLFIITILVGISKLIFVFYKILKKVQVQKRMDNLIAAQSKTNPTARKVQLMKMKMKATVSTLDLQLSSTHYNETGQYECSARKEILFRSCLSVQQQITTEIIIF